MTRPIDFFFIRINRSFVRVDHKDIVYIEGMGGYTKVVTEKKNYVTHVGMQDWEKALATERFVRVAKSYIVHLSKVSSFNSEYILIGEKKISLSPERKTDLWRHGSVMAVR